MKKLLIVSVALGCVAAVVAQTATSANVVGYVKEATPAATGFEIVSVNVLGEGDTVDIQDVFANLDDLNAGGSVLGDIPGALAVVDKVYVWNGGGYNTYGLYDAGASKYWMSSASSGWSKSAAAAPAVATLNRGDSVWFQTATGGAASDVMTVGEVPDDGTYQVNAFAGFTLVAYPYASSINLQDLVISNATSGGSVLGDIPAALAAVDKIYVWTGGGYNTYGLYDSGSGEFWMSSASSGWSKSAAAAPADADIELGKGVWFESVDGAKSIFFTQNYTLD